MGRLVGWRISGEVGQTAAVPRFEISMTINVNRWLLAAGLTVVIAVGIWMQSPENGLQLAGSVLIIAGLFGAIELLRQHNT